MIRWGPADCADLAAPSAAAALLEQAISNRPANALLQRKLADLQMERNDFAAAAKAFEAALRLEPDLPGTRPRLARCYNNLDRHRETVALLSAVETPLFERAQAFARLGDEAGAEREYRAVIQADPRHHPALRQLGKILRGSGRTGEMMEICRSLNSAGVANAQLLYMWGTALALEGRDEEAQAILLDRARVAELALPVPEGFSNIGAFNAALAKELLASPYKLSDFPVEDEANRGSSRVHALFAGRRPELARALIDSLQRLIAAYAPPRRDGFDPWAEARPRAAHLKAWGLIQRGGDYEEWHSHPRGWLSGVYYVQVPDGVTAEGEGPGCIEFGPPPALARERPGFVPIWRHAPREGHLLLAPSHYAHRTIPSGSARPRISFAFDVVPEA